MTNVLAKATLALKQKIRCYRLAHDNKSVIEDRIYSGVPCTRQNGVSSSTLIARSLELQYSEVRSV